jgi:hypothetical protein
LYFIPLANASRLWIPEMDQMTEIMHFSVAIVVMDLCGTPSLDAAQTPCHHGDTPKEPRLVPVKKFTKYIA